MKVLDILFVIMGIVLACYWGIVGDLPHAFILLFLINIFIDVSRSKHD